MFPLMGTINWMIFWELVRVFVISLLGLTGLFLVGGLIQSAAQAGLSPAQVLRVIPLIIPKMLPWTIPTASLFASCVVYGRLSNDNEAVAIKAAGVDLLKVLRPAVLMGLITGSVTGYLYYSVIPKTEQMFMAEALKDPEEVLYNLLRRDLRYSHPSFEYAIFVKEVQGRRLLDVIIKRRSTVNQETALFDYDYVTRTREARLVVDKAKGTLKIDTTDQWFVDGPNSTGELSDNAPPEVPLPDTLSGKSSRLRPVSLEWNELGPTIESLKEDREKIIVERAKNAERRKLATDPTSRQLFDLSDYNFNEQIRFVERQIRTVEYEYYIRPSAAVGCILFAIIGCPVGIWANRADYLSTFVISFLPTLGLYYPLLLAGGGLARDGKIPLAIGVWAADVVMAFASVLLTWKLIRR